MVLACHLLSHSILTTTKDVTDLTKPISQRRKAEAQRGTETKTRPHSATRLQVQALPHGCTTCVCLFRHMHAFLYMCMFVWRCRYEDVSAHSMHTRMCSGRTRACHPWSTPPDSLSSALCLYPVPFSKELVGNGSLSAWALSGFPQSSRMNFNLHGHLQPLPQQGPGNMPC